MKKFLVLIVAALLASGAFAQAFPDIPDGHWAGDAVAEIADLQIVIGFPDGTFRGNEAFTRYQAALVISRLLNVVEGNMDAALAMTQDDIASLRNAVQELAADLAAQGVRLSAAEGAVAGVSDDSRANAARLDELEALIEGLDMTPEIDPAVLRDLQNQIASQRVAIDTAQATANAAQELAEHADAAADGAQATADAAQADAAAAQADAASAQARANAAASSASANAAEVAALNELIQILSGQIDALEAGMGDRGPVGATADQVAALEGDIANIREFVILLRRDQVALRDSVSALEASDEQQSADIADLQARVTQLESNPLGISGSISLEYFVGRFSGAGAVFDIDRAYGVGFDRDIGASTFSSGTADTNADDDETDVGEVAQDRADIMYGSDFDASLTVTFVAGTVFDGEGSPRGLNSFEAVVTFELGEFTDLSGDVHYALALDEFEATFDPIGAAPLTFAFGGDVSTTFTPYTLARDGVGFIASAGAPDFLAFLDPALWVAYLTEDYDMVAGGEQIATGIRATVSPIDALTLGVSFVRDAINTGDRADTAADNINSTVWGVDAQASLELGAIGVDLAAEFANGNGANGAYTDSVLFVTADTTLNVLGGIDLGANYRDIAAGWDAGLGAGALLDGTADYPFVEDQTGFGVNVGLGLFIFDIEGYFDSYSVAAGDSTSAFGASATANLFRAFSVGGYYNQVSINGAVVDDNSTTERDDEYETGFGVNVAHDGSADNALIPMLNFEAAYERSDADFDDTRIYAAADYTLSVSIVTLTPYVSYESNVDADAGTDDTNEVKVGTGLTTAPLDIMFQPSLEASVNYRRNNHSDLAVYTSSQLQWAVGLNLGEFLLPYSSLTARYGSYTGTNITVGDVGAEGADDISGGDANTGLTSSVNGFEVEWDYYDLVFSYGIYNFDSDTATAGGGTETAAQAFRVAYTVDF